MKHLPKNNVIERKSTIIGCLMLFLLISAATLTPVVAQQNNLQPLTLLDDNWTLNVGTSNISPDGSVLAYSGAPGGLHLQNRQTHEDNLIVNMPNHGNHFVNIVFSPDGSRIMFEEMNGNGSLQGLYSAERDGSNLAQMMASVASSATYSPDGSMVAVEIHETARTPYSEEGYLRDDGHYYVVLIAATTANATPEKLAEVNANTPFFWSTDGTAIYYEKQVPEFNCPVGRTTCTGVWRYDLRAKDSTQAPGAILKGLILVKVPGVDAVIVRNIDNTGAETVGVLNLDGSSPSPELTKAAQSIPLKDRAGYRLQSIQEVGRGQLLLAYGDHAPSAVRPPKHVQLLRWQAQ